MLRYIVTKLIRRNVMNAQGLRTVSLVAATVSMGLTAGVFDLYAHTIMPGLRRTDDRTFVVAFRAIDGAIINPWFIGGSFIGALLLTAAAAITSRGARDFPWIVGALIAYGVAVAITIAIHVPLNDAIKAARVGDPSVNVAEVRAHFGETRWAAWNLARVVTSTGAFGGLAWALVLHGRATP